MRNWWTKLKFRKEWWVFLGWFLIYKFIKRSDLIEGILRSLPSREAGLLAGMVWGEKGGVTKDFYEALKNTGLVHIVVVSGANLMMVGKNLIEVSSKYIGRKVAIIWGLGIMGWYVEVVGWQIPVIRALIFIFIFYLAQLLGRKFDLVRALIVTVLLMIIADYRVLSDVSFWLSVGAFVGVVMSRNRGNLVTTMMVSLMIVPIISMIFGSISLITPITNMMVLYLVEIITVLGFGGSLVFLISNSWGKIMLMGCYPLLRYLIEVVELSGRSGWGVVNFRFNWWMLGGWYLLVGGIYARKKIQN